MVVNYSVVVSAFEHVEPLIVPGVTTLELDDTIATFAVINNATSAALGYKGYPRSSCISVNDVVLQ